MRKTSLFSETVQSELLANATLVKQPKGAVLFRRGEPCIGIFLVRNGTISLQLEAGEGQAIFDRVVERDAVVGLPATIAGDRYSLTATTLEQSELAHIERQTLVELMRINPKVGFEIMDALGEEVLRMRELLAAAPAATFPQQQQTASRSADLM
jgi:CRP-like cAMP-binding protein